MSTAAGLPFVLREFERLKTLADRVSAQLPPEHFFRSPGKPTTPSP